MKSVFASAALALIFVAPSAFAEDKTYCTLPGLLVAGGSPSGPSDPVINAVPFPVPGFKVIDVHVAEPPNDTGEEKVYFTLSVDAQAAAYTPGSSYEVDYTLSDGVNRWLNFNPYPSPSQLDPVTDAALEPGLDLKFTYGQDEPGTQGTTFHHILGAANAESTATGGTITMVISSKEVKTLKAGALLGNIQGIAQFNGVAVSNNLDASDPTGTYVLLGNDSCKGKSVEVKDAVVTDKSGTSFGGAFAPGLLMMLCGLAGLRRRTI